MEEANARARYYCASPGCPEYQCTGMRRTSGLLWGQPEMVVCDHLAKSALDANLDPHWADGTKLDSFETILVQTGMSFALGRAPEGGDIAVGLCFAGPDQERMCSCVAQLECPPSSERDRKSEEVAAEGDLADA